MSLENFLEELKKQALSGSPNRTPIVDALMIDVVPEHDRLTFTKQCVWCHGFTTFTVDQAKYNTWQRGAYIQVVWPELANQHREAMTSGAHDLCFSEMFAEPDDEV